MLAVERTEIFVSNPFDPRLETHKLTGELRNYWAFWIDRKNRIMFAFKDQNKVIFCEVGDHSIYR